jgi:hypothetical protein
MRGALPRIWESKNAALNPKSSDTPSTRVRRRGGLTLFRRSDLDRADLAPDKTGFISAFRNLNLDWISSTRATIVLTEFIPDLTHPNTNRGVGSRIKGRAQDGATNRLLGGDSVVITETLLNNGLQHRPELVSVRKANSKTAAAVAVVLRSEVRHSTDFRLKRAVSSRR